MSQPLAIILNGCSRSSHASSQRQLLAQLLQENSIDAKLFCAEKGEQIPEFARKAAEGPYRAVIAAGGDGTVNGVASVVVGTDRPMGVLPLGTLNNFARHLGIPFDLAEAVRGLPTNVEASVDAGEINGRIFVNNSSIGLYPAIVRQRERLQRRHGIGKWLAMTWATLLVLRRPLRLQVRLHSDDDQKRLQTPFVFVGNNEYQMGALELGKRHSLSSGLLGVCIPHGTGHFWMLRLLLRAFFGKLENAPDFDALTTSELWIETPHRRLQVATDGEVNKMETPLHYRSRPGALRVLVPPTSPEA